MRIRVLAIAAASVALVASAIAPAAADAGKPGASMTHLKTTAGLAATLEGAGVVLYGQGGATSGVIGDSLASPSSQVVFHIPVTGTKGGVLHLGSTLVLFNTTNDRQVQLRNPVVNVASGIVSATVPQSGSAASVPVLRIANAASLKTTVKTDRKAGVRTAVTSGADLVLASGAGALLNTLLGLPSGFLVDGASFGTAEVTVSTAVRR